MVMDAASGHAPADLSELLRGHLRELTLGQALRLLERAHAESPELPSFEEDVAIRPHLSLAFPAADITEIRTPPAGPPAWQLTTTLLGLYGTMGPLPTFYTEELLDEARADESLSRDFLDILNNRLYHLLYAAERQNRLARRLTEHGDLRAAHLLHCLMSRPEHGEAMPSIATAELLVCRHRSALRLQRSLAALLRRADVRVEECVERRVPIATEQRCRPGVTNAVLGESAVLGSELRDSTGLFRIHLDAVLPEEMPDFLHGGQSCRRIEEHVREYVRHSLEFELMLHPAPCPPRRTELGRNSRLGFFLGDTSRRAVVIVRKKETGNPQEAAIWK